MIATAARYGYRGTSVARVIKRAGVSRATFYEHFADRDDCFVAAFREIANRIEAAVGALEGDSGAAEPARAILARILAGAGRDGAAARFATIEALAGDAAVRAERERLFERIEAATDRYLAGAHLDTPPLEIPARTLVGGIAGVVAMHAFRGEAARLGELLDDLLAWINSYAAPGGRRRRSQAEWQALGKDLAASQGASAPPSRRGDQRDRFLAAVARLAREKGYTAMTVADLVAVADVSREGFYENFRSKEDAFLAAQAMGLQESVSQAAGAFFSGESWPDRVWKGLEAMLTYVAGQPDLVYVDLIESYAAGPAAIRRSFDNRMAYTLFLEDGYRQRPEAQALPRLCSEAIAGGILELLRRQVAEGRSERMLEVLPQAAYVALAPFTGPGEALDLVERRCRSAREST